MSFKGFTPDHGYEEQQLSDTNPINKLTWCQWYQELQKVAENKASVRDAEAWSPCWDEGKSPEATFYEEYPEFKPTETKATDTCVHKQHNRPCGDCPWRRNSAAGWLGASEPGEFLEQSESGLRMPCHTTVNYEKSDWKDSANNAPECAGHAIYLANRCKLPASDRLKLPSDRETVFSWPHEFVAHHAGIPVEALPSKIVYDLFDLKRSLPSRKKNEVSLPD